MVKDFLKKTFVAKLWRYYCRSRSAYIDKHVVPPYEEKRAILLEYKREFSSSVFIETGTFLGDSVAMFLKDFESLYSFELSKELALRAQLRFKDQPHVRIINADSGKELLSLTASIQKPTLYWLDGHYSSEFFVGEDFIKTARGEKDTPIVEELNAILTHGIKENVILIDDARCFNGANDYPSLRELKKLIYTLDPKVKVRIRRDIIRITPR